MVNCPYCNKKFDAAKIYGDINEYGYNYCPHCDKEVYIEKQEHIETHYTYKVTK